MSGGRMSAKSSKVSMIAFFHAFIWLASHIAMLETSRIVIGQQWRRQTMYTLMAEKHNFACRCLWVKFGWLKTRRNNVTESSIMFGLHRSTKLSVSWRALPHDVLFQRAAADPDWQWQIVSHCWHQWDNYFQHTFWRQSWLAYLH